MDQYVLVKNIDNIPYIVFEVNSWSTTKKQFAYLSVLRYNKEGTIRELDGENASNFISECNKHNIKLWEVDICKDIMNEDGQRKINLSDTSHCQSFWKYDLWSRVANLVYTLHEYSIKLICFMELNIYLMLTKQVLI